MWLSSKLVKLNKVKIVPRVVGRWNRIEAPRTRAADTGSSHSPGWRWARVPTGPGPGCACARGWTSPRRLARPALPQGLEGGTSLLGWKRRQRKWQAEHRHFCDNGKSLLGHPSILLLSYSLHLFIATRGILFYLSQGIQSQVLTLISHINPRIGSFQQGQGKILLPIPQELAEDTYKYTKHPQHQRSKHALTNGLLRYLIRKMISRSTRKRVDKVEIMTNKRNNKNSVKVKQGWGLILKASLSEELVVIQPCPQDTRGIHSHTSGHQCQTRFTEQFTSTLNSATCVCL